MTVRVPDPASPDLIVVRRAVRALDQELAALQEEVERYGRDPQPSCLHLAEGAAWRQAPAHTQRAHRRRLRQDVLAYARLATVSVIDHLWAVRQLLAVPGYLPLFAYATAGRAACEAAAKVGYLLNETIGYETRLLRGAVLLREDAESRMKAAKALPEDFPVAGMAVRDAQYLWNVITGRISRAGIIEICNSGGKPIRLQIPGLPGRGEPIKVVLSDLVSAAFPDRPNLYRQASGTAHSAPWMLSDAVVSSPGPHLELTPDILGIGATALVCIDAGSVVSAAYAAYYGHDPAPAVRARKVRTTALDLCMNDWFSRRRF
ncbi:hypothetical protein ACPXCJ_24545 [Micromonospora chalcea]|uniref:hypothetical protein n=1 Tax=Micromonospora chalcea TaxID=1874 RepID=UPI003CEA2678